MRCAKVGRQMVDDASKSRHSAQAEEELKDRVGADFWGAFDHTEVMCKTDSTVRRKGGAGKVRGDDEYLLWAEAKSGVAAPCVVLTLLVVTIGKVRTFDRMVPPRNLGCFDCEQIALFRILICVRSSTAAMLLCLYRNQKQDFRGLLFSV